VFAFYCSKEACSTILNWLLIVGEEPNTAY